MSENLIHEISNILSHKSNNKRVYDNSQYGEGGPPLDYDNYRNYYIRHFGVASDAIIRDEFDNRLSGNWIAQSKGTSKHQQHRTPQQIKKISTRDQDPLVDSDNDDEAHILPFDESRKKVIDEKLHHLYDELSNKESLYKQWMIPQQKRLLNVKPAESYPRVYNDEVKRFTFDKKHPAEKFGSFVFRAQRYAGDLDLTEIVRYHTEKGTITNFIKKLKLILLDLDKDHIFSEFKAGFDYDYMFSVGELRNGIYTPDKDFATKLNKIYLSNLLTDEEYDSMVNALEIVKKSHDTTIHEMAYDYIYDTMRNRYTLRWTKIELLRGFKILGNNSKYLLTDALKDDGIVKIDIISIINNKYVEVTNIISLEYDPYEDFNEILIKDIHKPIKYPKAINIDSSIIHGTPLGLQQEVEKLYYSNKFYSPFKACKRIYSLMRQYKKYDGLVNQLSPIIRHEISLLYQIKSELEAILLALQLSPTAYHLEHANLQLQDIKGRLNYVLYITNDQIKDFSVIIDFITDNNVIREKIELIDNLGKDIKLIIQFLTIDKMNQNKFNPFPSSFLPPIIKYNRSKVREAYDNPNAVFKNFVNSLKQ